MSALTVGDLMTTEPITVESHTPLTAVYDLMDRHRIRHLPVVEGEDLVGLVTNRDLLIALASRDEEPMSQQRARLALTRTSDVMTRGIETVAAEASIVEVAERMMENKYGCMPVCEGQRIVGIITESDFVKHVAESA